MIIKNKRSEMVRFDSVEEGEVFILHREDVYMKIDGVEDANCNIYNAVNLANGVVDYYKGDVMVQPVKCELVIE